MAPQISRLLLRNKVVTSQVLSRAVFAERSKEARVLTSRPSPLASPHGLRNTKCLPCTVASPCALPPSTLRSSRRFVREPRAEQKGLHYGAHGVAPTVWPLRRLGACPPSSVPAIPLPEARRKGGAGNRPAAPSPALGARPVSGLSVRAGRTGCPTGHQTEKAASPHRRLPQTVVGQVFSPAPTAPVLRAVTPVPWDEQRLRGATCLASSMATLSRPHGHRA